MTPRVLSLSIFLPIRMPLGFALLTYMLGIICVTTLLPFRFHWPDTLHLMWGCELFDTVANVALFVPLGFLYRLARSERRDRWCLRSLSFGLLISLCIELTQLFLIGRYSSPADLLTNGMGAWAGAALHDLVRRKFHAPLMGQLALELPLMNLFYLLLPLLWLNVLASGNDWSRLWLAPFLGLCGGSVLAAVWDYRLRPAGVLSANGMALIVAAWFFYGSIPGLAKNPVFLALCSIGVALTVRLQVACAWFVVDAERRFELPALLRVWPLYAVYLGLLALWPWPWMPGAWHASVGFAEIGDIPGVVPTLRVIEYFAAFTLCGYMAAESRGRQDNSFLHTLRWSFLCCLVIGGLLELARGFHPAHIASLAHVSVAVGAGLYGSVVYRMQLTSVQRLLTPDPVPETLHA